MSDEQPTQERSKSLAQVTLERIDRRDRVVRVLQAMLLFFVLAFNIFIAIQILQIIQQNNTASIERAEQATTQRNDQQGYIKCIVLLRYDNPGLGPDSPRADVEKALDACAKRVQNN